MAMGSNHSHTRVRAPLEGDGLMLTNLATIMATAQALSNRGGLTFSQDTGCQHRYLLLTVSFIPIHAEPVLRHA